VATFPVQVVAASWKSWRGTPRVKTFGMPKFPPAVMLNWAVPIALHPCAGYGAELAQTSTLPKSRGVFTEVTVCACDRFAVVRTIHPNAKETNTDKIDFFNVSSRFNNS
jgi:hypothetical protein